MDVRATEVIGIKLHCRNSAGRHVPIHSIDNRPIADGRMAHRIRSPFDRTQSREAGWTGHPDWYFPVSKFSLLWLSRPRDQSPSAPTAVLLRDFLDGKGREELAAAGVPLWADGALDMVYSDLLLKPLFSFAGKGIQFAPTQAQLEEIEPARPRDYLLQQRMEFVPAIETPAGLTQAEIRILYLWPDGGSLIPVMPLVWLGRGK